MGSLYISVIGATRCEATEYALAEEVGRLVAREGATLVCGGLGGVMEASARGAKEAGGVTIGILPGHDRAEANPYIDHALTTGMGHARNLAVVSSGDAVIAVGGRYGTLSEIGLAAKIGRPVVIVAGWRLEGEGATGGVWYAGSPGEAIALVRAAFDHPALWREEPPGGASRSDEPGCENHARADLEREEPGHEEPGREEPGREKSPGRAAPV